MRFLIGLEITRRSPETVGMPDKAAPGTPYIEFLAELEEIQRLKWLVSELKDRDIGFEVALNEWAHQHRAEWRRERNGLLRAGNA